MPLAVCATPIGNLEDVTFRVVRELAGADLVLCEDTRRTRVLLARHGVRTLSQLVSYHRHNEARRVAEVVPRLRAGERVALVSDAGLPGVNDPGARLVRAALDADVAVTVLPGPSAVETALVASGLVGEQYRFVGWLPRTAADRAALWRELVTWPHPAVAFESPQRLGASLTSLAGVAPEREVAVCRELTKKFEEIVRGSAGELAARFVEAPRGEITLVIGPGSRRPGEDRLAQAVEGVCRLVGAGAPRRVAVDVVAGLTGVSRGDLYDASL
jgi:16S rRNA (cytidine1402-2'-O)-methyltransferase